MKCKSATKKEEMSDLCNKDEFRNRRGGKKIGVEEDTLWSPIYIMSRKCTALSGHFGQVMRGSIDCRGA